MANKSLSSLFEEGINEQDSRVKIKSEESISGLLFKAINDTHITHLMNKDKTLARHKALEIFYEAIPDSLDCFIETSLPLYKITDIVVEESKCIDNPLQYFKDLYDKIEVVRKQYKESFLQNQIDGFQEEIMHAIYRLTYITT